MHRLPLELQGCVLQRLSRREIGVALRCDRRCARMMQPLAALLRAHSALRLYPCVRALRGAWLDAREVAVLARICRRVRETASPTQAPYLQMVDPPSTSLKTFNASIGWLEDYRLNSEFLDLLSEVQSRWASDEQAIVEHWKKEFVEFWCFGWRDRPADRATARAEWTAHVDAPHRLESYFDLAKLG